MPASAWLFDLDGTLIDSVELIHRSFQHTFEAHFGRTLPREEWLEGLGRPLRWHFGRYARDPAQVEAMIATYRAFNLAHHDAMVTAFPDCAATLERLAKGGARLAIVTSKLHAGARRGLVHCGLERYFDVVIGADDVDEHKPHPAPVRRALERLDVAPRDAVMVGDSPHDVAAGRAAGTRTIAVTWGPFPRETFAATPPDRFAASFADLLGE